MALIIYTDPHIGLQRAANTTPASRLKLQQSIINTLHGFLPAEMDYDNGYVCAGDLFDSYSNPESVIMQGADIVAQTDMLLAGNHDVTADADKTGSLELIKAKEKGCIIVHAPFGEARAVTEEVSEVLVTMVPHVTTQELFEQSLTKAVAQAQEQRNEGHVKSVLILHCNYDSPHELTETSLNLTPSAAEDMLAVFDYVILGHEHQPRDLFDGRLIILGNVHPTGFSDISNKRVAIIDGEGVTFKQVWNKSEHYSEHNVSDMTLMPMATTGQFVRLTGTVPSDQLSVVSKGINTLWKNSPNLLAVRSEVKVQEITEVEEIDVETAAHTLPEVISKELESDPAMKAMWEEFTNRGVDT